MFEENENSMGRRSFLRKTGVASGALATPMVTVGSAETSSPIIKQ
ncbi:twin-arginine translocation signal domain-containing protein [Halorutilales archaeon Cl-col2-1]